MKRRENFAWDINSVITIGESRLSVSISLEDTYGSPDAEDVQLHLKEAVKQIIDDLPVENIMFSVKCRKIDEAD